MSLFASFLLLLLILVETAPPTASSVPTLGKSVLYIISIINKKSEFAVISILLCDTVNLLKRLFLYYSYTIVLIVPNLYIIFIILGLYYCFNMIIIMMSIFLSSIVININRRGLSGTEPVPDWLKKVRKYVLLLDL